MSKKAAAVNECATVIRRVLDREVLDLCVCRFTYRAISLFYLFHVMQAEMEKIK